MRPLRLVVLPLLALLIACGSDNTPAPGTGGTTGSGGRPGTGGAGGSAGTGGAPGTGGGGAGSGGSAGDAGAPDGGGTNFLDECFKDVRALAARSQTARKRSDNGAYEVRLALEAPPDSVGTSGTRPWRLVRIGIVTPRTTVCLKDEAMLAAAYKSSHHNCTDTLTVTSNGLNYKLDRPDTDPVRPPTTLTITGEAAVPAVMLPTVSCTDKAGAACKSGGPCM